MVRKLESGLKSKEKELASAEKEMTVQIGDAQSKESHAKEELKKLQTAMMTIKKAMGAMNEMKMLVPDVGPIPE